MIREIRQDLDSLIEGDCNPSGIYRDEMVSLYDLFHREVREEWLESQYEKVSDIMSQKEVDNVLEIGCGTGLLASRLKENFDFDYTGVDNSEEMIEVARKRLDEDSRLVNCSIDEFEFDETYDLIIMLGNTVNEYPYEWFEGFFKDAASSLSSEGDLVYDFISQDDWDIERPCKIIEGDVEEYKIIRADFSREPQGDKEKSNHYISYKTYKLCKGSKESEFSFKSDIYPHLASLHFNTIENEIYKDYQVDSYREDTCFVRVSNSDL